MANGACPHWPFLKGQRMSSSRTSASQKIIRPRVFLKIIRVSGLLPTTVVFVVLFLVSSFAIEALEPGIPSFGDAVWFLFEAITTIGFGDYTCTTFLGRAITITLSLYAIFFFALSTGSVVSYCAEVMERQRNESVASLVDKLERLPELSHEELVDISERVKHIMY